jgi:hypothetical protein
MSSNHKAMLQGSDREATCSYARLVFTESQILDPGSFDVQMLMLTVHAALDSRVVVTRGRAPLHLASISNTNSPRPHLVRTHVKQHDLSIGRVQRIYTQAAAQSSQVPTPIPVQSPHPRAISNPRTLRHHATDVVHPSSKPLAHATELIELRLQISDRAQPRYTSIHNSTCPQN